MDPCRRLGTLNGRLPFGLRSRGRPPCLTCRDVAPRRLHLILIITIISYYYLLLIFAKEQAVALLWIEVVIDESAKSVQMRTINHADAALVVISAFK